MSHKLHCIVVHCLGWKLQYVCIFNLPEMKHCCVYYIDKTFFLICIGTFTVSKAAVQLKTLVVNKGTVNCSGGCGMKSLQ